jgi:L-lactate dehydrogenase complex protein LldG
MSKAKEQILQRIQHALDDHPRAESLARADLQVGYSTAIDRTYRQRDNADREQIIGDFIERVTEYKATVRRIQATDLPAKIAETLAGRKVQRLVVPADLPDEWLPGERTVLL